MNATKFHWSAFYSPNGNVANTSLLTFFDNVLYAISVDSSDPRHPFHDLARRPRMDECYIRAIEVYVGADMKMPVLYSSFIHYSCTHCNACDQQFILNL